MKIAKPKQSMRKTGIARFDEISHGGLPRSRTTRLQLRLYVAGSTQNSTTAIANISALCREHLPGRHHLEIVDVTREPMRALDDGVLMTPTLVKFVPAPKGKIVGTLSESKVVLDVLGLQRPPA